jgi:hypothetical protein
MGKIRIALFWVLLKFGLRNMFGLRKWLLRLKHDFCFTSARWSNEQTCFPPFFKKRWPCVPFSLQHEPKALQAKQHECMSFSLLETSNIEEPTIKHIEQCKRVTLAAQARVCEGMGSMFQVCRVLSLLLVTIHCGEKVKWRVVQCVTAYS